MDISLILLVFGYMLLSLLTVAGYCWWFLRRQSTKPPEPIKLLRGPGEGLRRRIHAFDEEAIMQFLAALACPPLVVFLSLVVVRLLPLDWQAAGILTSFLLGLWVLGFASTWIARNIKSRRNHMLGYFGERAVADELQKLARQGYFIFHDVPAQARKKDINIDHVCVGSTGIAVIETKTRRQGPGRPGFAPNEVIFDGSKLIWPWGEDDHGLEQLEAEAVWLGQWIEQETGIRLSTKAYLALPGWKVINRAQGRISVLAPADLPAAIGESREVLLTEAQINSIAALLDSRCRTVED